MEKSSNSTALSEEQRILHAYATREKSSGHLDLFALYTLQERQTRMLIFFRGLGLSSLETLRILDIGCGSGAMLRRLIDFGVEPKNCFGIDLRPEAVHYARRMNPNISFTEGDVAQLPFGDETFDIALQSTVFTSVLDRKKKHSMAAEIIRTLKPGGHLIWYDFAYSNPRNRNVRGIRAGEVRELFHGCQLQFHRVTLAPPIGRVAARFSPFLCKALWSIPLLRTHYLCFAQKPQALGSC